MRKNILLLTLLMLFSNSSHTATSSEITKLIISAKQQYKDGSYESAVSLYKQAAALGSPKALKQLSSLYKFGKVVKKDDGLANRYLQEAIEIYEKRANKGDVDAEFNMGRIYSYGIKPPKKLKAFNWFLKAAENGHMKAQYVIATTLNNGSLEPEIKRNHDEAMRWYEKSAKQGNSHAAHKISYYNSNDFDIVLKYCMPVAKNLNDKMSTKCLEILNLLLGRKIHSEKYKKQSVDAIFELANSNIVMSQIALATMYEKGTVITKNVEEAKKWVNKAFSTALLRAQQGDKQSQYELARFYKKGIGADVSLDKYQEWLSLSAKQRYKPAIKALAKYNIK